MLRKLSFFSLLLACLPAVAAPALVTSTSGDLQLVTPGLPPAPAPGVPFLMPDAASLVLADKAEAVVMVSGTAKRWSGPVTLGGSALVPNEVGPERGGSQLAALLSGQASISAPGATRDGVLQRPVDKGRLVALQRVQWRCPAPCEAVEVSVDGLLDGSHWTGSGAGSVSYAGPPLAPGPYTLDIGGRGYTFQIVDKATATTIEAARSEARAEAARLEGATTADKAGIVAGVLFTLGFPSEGLAELDAAGPEAAQVRLQYETFARVAAPPAQSP